MLRAIDNIWHLVLKEFASLAGDRVMLVLIFYAFSMAIVTVANGVKLEVSNASVAVVDLDHSRAVDRIVDAVRPPYFRAPVRVDPAVAAEGMDRGRYTFLISFPPAFEADLLAGRKPEIGLTVDATAMTQAGNGVAYLREIVATETARYLSAQGIEAGLPVAVVIRQAFNPNLDGVRYNAVMQMVNSITILSIILVGAAVIREREHGTIEHLLVMPVRPTEIALGKIIANGLVVLLAVFFAIEVVLRGVLAVPIAGSVPLFLAGTAVYLFATTALGIVLATLANSMPQLGLMAIPVFVTMQLLSGAMTPLESMPKALQDAMHVSPSVYFVQFSQAILYRGAGFEVVWFPLAMMAGIGAVLLAFAVSRFRRMLEKSG
ncbi:ABC transporter permease [Prosthecomicrobium hirschii]|uniref:ABC transporter permease n=1 Tax=Prosthecodimorpha hirschii TaxID=665126 RepID=UPI0011281DAE|nr:ABC transporter permease [Prosthecomicrobium hirschii]TPQ48326.1 ABC transporter permease [Prosthecomicrobium hirschii]